MKTDSLQTIQLTRSAETISAGATKVSGCVFYWRISRTVERGILGFVVLLTLLESYGIHGYLMRDVMLS